MEGIAPPSTAWLPVYRLGKSINLNRLAPILPRAGARGGGDEGAKSTG